MNTLGGTGLWNEEDGFYYDHLHVDGQFLPLKLRSLVGLIPLIAADTLEDEVIAQDDLLSTRAIVEAGNTGSFDGY